MSHSHPQTELIPQFAQNDGSNSVFMKHDLLRVLFRIACIPGDMSSHTAKNRGNKANTEKKESN